ncbi:MAG: aldo/keto reductase, partial [Planktotalea sp.]|uniref:aldo/keto reductase n=1 Tax=Planktotalea sp. TaxID=2029877 RepID=UPI003C73BEBA
FKLQDWSLLQSAMSTPLATNQIELSLLAHEGFTNGDVAYLQERKVAPMAWSPLAGGALFSNENKALLEALKAVGEPFGADETAVAVAWLLAHPARIMPVLGTNSLERIAKISDALKVKIDRQTWFELYTIALGNEVP